MLKQNVVPIKGKKGIIWKGIGKKTVDVFDLEQRFNSLKIKFDWKKFKEISALRNEIEHYYTAANQLAVQEALSKLFALMRNFMMRELKIDPKKKLDNRLWEILINIDQVYKEEAEACRRTHKYFKSSLENLDNHISEYSCSSCGSNLVRFKPGGSSDCRACGETLDKEHSIMALIESVYGADDYSAVKDGDEPIIATCPECSEDSYIMTENSCALCGTSQQHTCQRCSCSIPASEIGGEYCSYCQHMID